MSDCFPSGSDARASTTLRRLAALLERPVETFFQPLRPEDPFEGALELLWLWGEITDAQARRRVLSLAQREAGRQGRPQLDSDAPPEAA